MRTIVVASLLLGMSVAACTPTPTRQLGEATSPRQMIDIAPLHKDWATCEISGGGQELEACLITNLRAAEAALKSTYTKLLKANSGDEAELISQEQQLWLVLRDRECRVTLQKTTDSSQVDALAADSAQALCVLTLTRVRESELRLYGGSSLGRMMAARVQPRRTYHITSLESRDQGKWYFEALVDATQLAFVMDAMIFVGVHTEAGDVGRLISVRPDGGAVGGLILLPGKARVGIAIDLDAGQVYVRENGKWLGGAPGSGAGFAIRKNGRVKAAVNSSIPLNAVVDQKLVQLNFGGLPFIDPAPVGYSPYRTGNPSRDQEINSPGAGIYVTQ